jgi:hypothetical protein
MSFNQNQSGNTNNNSQFTDININTSGITLFDVNGLMMRMSFFDKVISIDFNQPVDDGSGTKRYPKENKINVTLSLERAEAFLQVFYERFLKAYEKGNHYRGGVLVNKSEDSIFEISTGENDNMPEINYYWNIGQNRVAGNMISFKFKKTCITEKYVAKDGSCEATNIDAQAFIFAKAFDTFVKAATGAIGHDVRYTNRFTTNKIIKVLENIAVKMGIAVQPQTRPFSKPQNETGYTIAQEANTPTANPPSTEISDQEFMNMIM